MKLESEITRSAKPARLDARQVAREFRQRLEEGAALRPAGGARANPDVLIRGGYLPKYRFDLFGTTFYTTNLRFDDLLGFFVAYVAELRPDPGTRRGDIFPRIFYKDLSLVWRSATHLIRSENEIWVGKGALKPTAGHDDEMLFSAEETTDLPFEIQPVLDELSRRGPGARRDNRATALILRNAPDNRIAPYADFDRPRARAAETPANRINQGREIARFGRKNVPESLRFVSGFEPDFEKGVLEMHSAKSRFYGGIVRKFRILSKNRRIQYLFMSSPRHTWIIPPQALTTEIMTYGVRTVDVEAPEDLCVPGYEYHYYDEDADPPGIHSQIPEGYAGEPSPFDETRASASAWLDRLPVIREFKRKVLKRG